MSANSVLPPQLGIEWMVRIENLADGLWNELSECQS